jgi:hypothetical protein
MARHGVTILKKRWVGVCVKVCIIDYRFVYSSIASGKGRGGEGYKPSPGINPNKHNPRKNHMKWLYLRICVYLSVCVILWRIVDKTLEIHKNPLSTIIFSSFKKKRQKHTCDDKPSTILYVPKNQN